MHDESFYVGKAVTSLQTMLRTVARCREGLPMLIPDGVYGERTVRCVKAFQRMEGLPVTGTTDEATWNAVRCAFDSAAVEVGPAAPIRIEMGPNEAMAAGCSLPYVLLAQAMLHTLHGQFGNIDGCPLSGVMDEETMQAVRCLQRCCGMPESGIINKPTWRMLTALYTQTTTGMAQEEA